ncbi:MAG: HNH endonuclease [Roseofilum sp. Guam]|nr:group II intron maturase-specific domain-containing protein [Roseofilum sp. Guam]MBP0031143.1 HNH endonuclease [Roseofilum sp. Guam]
MQAMVKMALEPYWEARFEGTSYGFRPGRSAHDAIARIYTVRNQSNWFDFLGFNIRQYPVGKYKSGKNSNGNILGFKTIIKPSQKAIKAHREAVKSIIKKDKTAPQAALIKHLNLVIQGWCNYFSGVSSKETFSREDHIIWLRLRAWTVSRTGKANYQKLRKYFSHGKNGTWTFQTRQEGYHLLTHDETPIKRHTLVQPDKSPYDGDWTYWSKRRGQHIGTSTRVSKLLKKQKGKCNFCGMYFTDTDLVEVDHIIPKSLGGKDEYKNLQLLHKHCHDSKTSNDGSLNRTNDKD